MQIYNTLTRKKEKYVPHDQIKVYVCGVTPYDEAHLGHARPSIVWDVIRRYFNYLGYSVKMVQNFTDVDDKIIARSIKENRSALEISNYYSKRYLEAMDNLGVQRCDKYPKVSDYINKIISFIEGLIEKGHAYEANGDVYFSVASFDGYGKLSGRNVDELRAGARIDIDEIKKDPADFALWKRAKPGEISWSSPWGEGRPGWHIECSTMSLDLLGESFDFHGGGLDLIFPHHENEVAQSEAYTNKQFVNFWIHNGLITVDNEKMSKSLGNFITVEDLLRENTKEEIRFYILSSHYRTPLNFTWNGLKECAKGLKRINNSYNSWRKKVDPISWQGIEELEDIESRFRDAMDDDFNTAQALGVMFELCHVGNGYLRSEDPKLRGALSLLQALGNILGILKEEEPKETVLEESLVDDVLDILLEIRQDAKTEKNWALSDRIRDKLASVGIVLEDTAQGTRWRLVD
ncbi:MAG: cysteine--tRNA ligase [Firmicutes bacterium]|nr:cysteine--tRNA ligase [Bacillota bacterium]MDD4263737.1 cysteine--tRNA ligase [Bacillota bacterium]MDD4693090.1 cysteine--tRNA ligase [Bacillota bacterium]